MATYKIRCRRNFKKIKIDELDVFALIVLSGIYNNVITFPMPTIAQAMFQALIDTYMTKRSGYKGGTVSKGDFEIAKTALINALFTLADYVDSVAQGDVNIILLSGYQPTKGSPSAAVPPARAENVKLEIAAPGEMNGSCAVVAGAENYCAILAAEEPLPVNTNINGFGQLVVNDGDGTATPAASAAALSEIKFVLDFNKSRIKKFTGLTKGTVYYLYYFSINAAGVSPLSIAVSLDAW
ncbi:MAG: hypothetical protein AB7G44_07225 [Bacteroidia bacterium]